ncbi:flagellar hook-associated protein FlgL [Pantoea vagans]|uniref:flagellar hook-associated protein FlgL n=1 Tax=Pantoea vagans TaxID=470934 RepID=UPI003FA3B60F
MRFSTHYMYQQNIDSISKSMASGNDVNSRLSAGQTLLTPSDDPAGASQAVTLQNALSSLSQYGTARSYAQNALGQEDNTLSTIQALLTGNLTEKIVAGGNGSLSDQDRQAVATEIQGIRSSLLESGNTRDSNGRFIFAGYKTGSDAFDKEGRYVGGDTPLTQSVNDNVDMQVGHTGKQLFMSGSSDDLLAALDKAVNALNKPVTSDDDRQALQSTLDSVNKTIKKNIDNIGKMQSQVGTNLQQLDALTLSSDTQKINLTTRLQQALGSDSDTQISLITQSKMSEFALTSSMTVFQTMQKMSIFNFR